MASFPCASCSAEVRPRQQALQCDICDQWQHRTCDSGVSQTDYRRMVRGELEKQWYCVKCTLPEITDVLVPVAESTTVDTAASYDTTMEIDDTEVQPVTDISTRPPVPDVLVPVTESAPDDNITPVPDISTRPPIPAPCEEDIIPDDTLENVPSVGEHEISYKLIEGATRGGKTLMVDSLGYTYNRKALGKKKTQIDGKSTWRCSVRSKALTCPATVSKNGSTFHRGSRPHVHQAQPDAAIKA
ncbi:hypothetical protein Pmani_007357 [Petrolisthes manimaculis]|nr:hypothetical protein Pmani_007357 [Petrolisthes manimaculis]